MRMCWKCLEDNENLISESFCKRCCFMQYFNLEDESSLQHKNTREKRSLKLTNIQQRASNQIIDRILKQSIFVDAVCGAGKTEICIPVLRYLLEKGLNVGWAIPRREVVIELAERIQSYLEDYHVTAVFGGCVDKLAGDLIICTTHQLFRYPQYFDVLILDEPDAFPFVNDALLLRFAKLACRGTFLYLSATYDIDHVHRIVVPLRPSGKLLPVPTVKCRYFPIITLLRDLMNLKGEMVLIFVPTMKIGKGISRLLRCALITSECVDKESILSTFREKRNWIVCTTILERGVTFENCYVCVYEAHHRVFSESSLVQIAGRVMRGMKPLKGTVVFYCREYSTSLLSCVDRIKIANDAARGVLNQSMQEKA